MRVRLKGIHRVKARLANGAVKIYHYAWRGGPQLTAVPGTPEFIAQFNEAHASVQQPKRGTLMTIIAQFKGSAEYNQLSQSSKRAYMSYMRLIENEFGDMPLAALSDRRVRGEFKAWRDGFAATPRKADYAWTTLARLMSFAKDRGMIDTNRCEHGGRLYAANRADNYWKDADVEAVLSVAPPHLQLAVILALWTGQRQGDLLQLPWSAYDGKQIRLVQSKTGRRLVIPVGEPLRLILDRTERRGTIVLLNSHDRPWTSDGFRSSWAKAGAKANIAGLTFHDLRGSAVVRLALAEATVPQIATITGHSLKDVEAILDAHYLGRDVQLAEMAIAKLERRTKL